MSIPSASKTACIAGTISLFLFWLMVGFGFGGQTFKPIGNVDLFEWIGRTSVNVFLLATTLLWVLDWVLLCRVSSSPGGINFWVYAVLLIIGTIPAAYAVYLLLSFRRPVQSPIV